MSKDSAKFLASIRATLASHAIRRQTGWTWSCRKPGDSAYAYRVTWCPYNLIVTGDIGEIVITHYSFTDPWAAAAWINGADFDYCMSKSNVQKTYSPEATVQGIIEDIYAARREDDWSNERARRLLDAVADLGCIYSVEVEHTPAWRKSILRQLRDVSLPEHEAYEITGDAEAISYRYPERAHWHHEALRLWAEWMWVNEPAWHKVVRVWRRNRSTLRDLRSHQIAWGPVRYEYINERGQASMLNGLRYWVFRRNPFPAFHGIVPLRIFGRDLSAIGLWRMQGSVWSVSQPSVDKWGHRTRDWQFRDVREVS